MKEESDDDDDNNAKAFDFVIESQKSEVIVGKKECKKKSDKSVREGKEKEVKKTGGFMGAEEENLTEVSEENRNISWSSNTEKIKEAISLDYMGVTSRTEPIVNYQEGQNIAKNDHEINITSQTDNTIMIYNEITKEVYIDKPERAKPNSSSNHNTDESNIHLAKLKQEIKTKHIEEEANKAEIMKGVVENGEIIQELEVKSCEKGKTESKVEAIEVKKQLVGKTTRQKEYHNISEKKKKKGVESKITCNKIAYNLSSKEQESSSQVKQIYDELIQENDCHTKIRNQRQLKTEQSQQRKIPDVDTVTKSKKIEDQNKKFKSKDSIKYSTEKNGINNRVQNIGETIEDKVPVEMASIQTKIKQEDNDVVAKKTSNYQQQKEATRNGQR